MYRPQALLVMRPDTFRMQFGDREMQRLRSLADLGDPVWSDDIDAPCTRTRLAETEVLFTSWGCPSLTAERLDAAPKLQAVFHCAGSVRGLVSDEFWRREIVVTSGAQANATPVAEYTLAAIIFAGKKAPLLAAQTRMARNDWYSVAAREDLSNYGRTIGILGFSRIGRLVAERLRMLDTAAVLVTDPYADPAAVAAVGGRLVSLDELLSTCDILSLHLPELPQTRHTIGSRELALMPDGATVINTARGGVIDTAALERECVSGRLNAILDVTDPEPLPASSLLYRLDNVMITPHIAGSLGSETRRMSTLALDELDRFITGLPLAEAVTSQMLEVSA